MGAGHAAVVGALADSTSDNVSYVPVRYSTSDNSKPPDVPETGVSTVRIGALFPMFKTEAAGYGLDTSGVRRFSSFYMALKEINDKSDGVADHLLPNTQLLFRIRDSKRSNGKAFLAAIDLASEVFNKEGVAAIIGAASSGPSASAATITAQFQVPQISYSSTSPALSDGKQYSYFMRTPPSDALEGEAIADVLRNYMGYTYIATVNSDDSYGSGGVEAFRAAAVPIGIADPHFGQHLQ